MDEHLPPNGRSSIDPLLDGGPRRAELRPRAERSRRRPHPARTARAVALTASIVATGLVGVALAYFEGAWSADNEAVTSASTGAQEATTNSGATETSATETPASETPASDTPSVTTPAVTVPASSTTQPADDGAGFSGYADGDYVGTAEYTEWGDVQVQVTISDGAIVDVAALEYPTGRKSSEINDEAIPLLEADAVAVQGADLDIVSGATYTSRTYADSLQAALDQAAAADAERVAS
jgi:uncharacterized protein with FMN-binding domain